MDVPKIELPPEYMRHILAITAAILTPEIVAQRRVLISALQREPNQEEMRLVRNGVINEWMRTHSQMLEMLTPVAPQ